MATRYDEWSRAEIDLMRRLWNQEGKSAEEIASAIGKQFGVFRTRSAICGKIARMPGQFAPRGKAQAATEARQARRIADKRAPVAKSTMPAERPKPLPASLTALARTRPRGLIAASPVTGKTLADCGPRGCRFPVGEREEQHLFCNAPIPFADWRPGLVNGCYCAAHRVIATGERYRREAV